MDYRAEIIRRLKEDLIGPHAEDEFLCTEEGKPVYPSELYLYGILWPGNAPMPEDEETGFAEIDDEVADDILFSPPFRPSSMGLSFAVNNANAVPEIDVQVSAAVYRPENRGANTGQQRQPVLCLPVRVRLDRPHLAIPLNARWLEDGVYLYARTMPYQDLTLCSVMLVNGMTVNENSRREEVEQVTLFQTGIRITPVAGTRLIARPQRKACTGESERTANLLYRHCLSFATGHTCSASWEEDAANPGQARSIATCWLPEVRVPDMHAGGHAIFKEKLADGSGLPQLTASRLAHAQGNELRDLLLLIPEAYLSWLEQVNTSGIGQEHEEMIRKQRATCEEIAVRLEAGARRIAADPVCARAFNLANAAMLKQFQWKNPGQEMIWRPFQLGFILLAAPSTLRPLNPDQDWLRDRKKMDLLWFPTGGGKTEAYLGLIAMLLFHRRLRNPKNPDAEAGVAAIMRYTLRLLTTQQFMRASALIFACELLRRHDEKHLGSTPFAIGLWVGENATPNDLKAAREALNGNPAYPTPAQLASCPACGQELEWEATTKDVIAKCGNASCELASLEHLPVCTVDETVYKHKPALLIGTIDKFAQIVRKKEINALFGLDRKSPPDLIIQDELHLLTGPLGSIAGLYETMVDGLFARSGVPVKIIGSTATIRNAASQIRSLYDREASQFPPAFIDAADSGFAVEDRVSPGRIYCGLTAAGRSMKMALEKIAASLLQSASALAARADDPGQLDPWWTLVGYFNSLRELGGALVLMQDETRKSAGILAQVRNEEQREIWEVSELTSRLSQLEVRDMLGQMGVAMNEPGCLDIVLASSMLSVGVDVGRLGMMMVNGQPKSMSEYIQATSRVGRGATPGLVLTLYSHSRPRDRSHYENFVVTHKSLYRDIESVSVTPFAPRARDKALHAVLAGLLRHLDADLLAAPSLGKAAPDLLARVKQFIMDRAASIDSQDPLAPGEIDRLLADWKRRAPAHYWNQAGKADALMQSAEETAARAAAGRARGAPWPTLNSMRDVEPGVSFRLAFRPGFRSAPQ